MKIYKTELDSDKMLKLVESGEAVCKKDYKFTSPEGVVELLERTFRIKEMAEERVYALYFTNTMTLIGLYEVSHGTVNKAVCSPKDIFKVAMLCNASSIIVAHNHTSGDPTPSVADYTTARNIFESGKMLDVNVADFIIIGTDDFYSYEAKGEFR